MHNLTRHRDGDDGSASGTRRRQRTSQSVDNTKTPAPTTKLEAYTKRTIIACGWHWQLYALSYSDTKQARCIYRISSAARPEGVSPHRVMCMHASPPATRTYSSLV